MQTSLYRYQDTYTKLAKDPNTPSYIRALTPREFERVWNQMTPLQRLLLGAQLWAEEAKS